MDFIHAREYLQGGDVVIVNCSHQCNALLTDDFNFSSYQSGGQFHYYGGHYKQFPVRIVVPSAGFWNVTIDLGGGAAQIRYNISYLKKAS